MEANIAQNLFDRLACLDGITWADMDPDPIDASVDASIDASVGQQRISRETPIKQETKTWIQEKEDHGPDSWTTVQRRPKKSRR